MNKEVSCSKSRDLCPEVPPDQPAIRWQTKRKVWMDQNLNICCLRATRICSKRSRAQDVLILVLRNSDPCPTSITDLPDPQQLELMRGRGTHSPSMLPSSRHTAFTQSRQKILGAAQLAK